MEIKYKTVLDIGGTMYLPHVETMKKTVTKVIDGVEWHREVEVEEPSSREITIFGIVIELNYTGKVVEVKYRCSDGETRLLGDMCFHPAGATAIATRNICDRKDT